MSTPPPHPVDAFCSPSACNPKPRGAVRRRRVVVCAAFLAAIGLVGCSSSGDSPSAATEASTATSAGTSSASASSTTAAPAGTQWAEATGTGVRFAVPETWTVNDPAKVLAQGDPDAIEKVAEALGVTASQFEDAAKSTELYVMGPTRNGFSPNISVMPNSLTSMPTSAAMASDMESIGAKVGTARNATTPLGDAVVLPYTIQLGAYTVEGRLIAAETPNGVAAMGVSHTSAERADALTEQILATLGAL